MDQADIIAALVAYLKSDSRVADVTGGHVYGEELPKDITTTTPRSAVVLRASGGVSLTAGSYARHDTRRIDFVSYGATPREAAALGREVRAALGRIRRQVIAATLIHWADPAAGPINGRDADTRWPLCWQPFQIFHALEETT